MFATLALAALLIEAAFGYPDRLYRRIGHPVTWIGALIDLAERGWNLPQRAASERRAAGIRLICVLVLVAGGVALGLQIAIESVLPMLPSSIVLGLLASTALAQRSLDKHVSGVASALEQEGLAAGRKAVSEIVGRDPDALDEAGVSRAAIESLAENFSDGVVAPLFWLVVAGLPGAAIYKAINTADSMIGHKSERYRAFGWAAARLDDVVNLPASRLAALWLVAAAALTPDASARGALRAVGHDARRHHSPNAGWPESAMAGALGLRLAGPRAYGGKTIEDHWMGDGRADLSAADICAALRLYRVACVLQAVGIAALAFVMSQV